MESNRHEVLGNTDNLEEDLTKYWEDSFEMEMRVQRWFWLNEAKKQHFHHSS